MKVEAQHTVDGLRKKLRDYEAGVTRQDSLRQLVEEQKEQLEERENLLKIKSAEIEDRDDRLIQYVPFRII